MKKSLECCSDEFLDTLKEWDCLRPKMVYLLIDDVQRRHKEIDIGGGSAITSAHSRTLNCISYLHCHISLWVCGKDISASHTHTRSKVYTHTQREEARRYVGVKAKKRGMHRCCSLFVMMMDGSAFRKTRLGSINVLHRNK